MIVVMEIQNKKQSVTVSKNGREVSGVIGRLADAVGTSLSVSGSSLQGG